MVHSWPDGARIKVTVEGTFRISDVGALEQAALALVETVDFTGRAGVSAEEERSENLSLVRSSPAEAFLWISDPDGLAHGFDGVQCEDSIVGAEMVPDLEVPRPLGPDFVQLFRVCRCDGDECSTCEGFQMTPRTAAVLWSTAQLLADNGFDDVDEHGDARCHDDGRWALFDQYPKLTWGEDAVWRRQASRALDDLAGDIAQGGWPLPTCAGEEMALHLMLRTAEAAVDDDWSGLESHFADLPRHQDDLEWSILSDVLFQDHDILALFERANDGLEDPDAEENRNFGMGDYRPVAWFRPFNNATPRDGRRPFRR